MSKQISYGKTYKTTISIDSCTEPFFRLNYILRNNEAILLSAEIEKDHILNVFVEVNEESEFLTLIQNFAVYLSQNTQLTTNIDKRREILNQVRRKHQMKKNPLF